MGSVSKLSNASKVSNMCKISRYCASTISYGRVS